MVNLVHLGNQDLLVHLGCQVRLEPLELLEPQDRLDKMDLQVSLGRKVNREKEGLLELLVLLALMVHQALQVQQDNQDLMGLLGFLEPQVPKVELVHKVRLVQEVPQGRLVLWDFQVQLENPGS